MINLFLSMAFASSPSPEVSNALRRKDCDTAVQLMPAPEPDNYKLAIGECYLRMGNSTQANKLLEEVKAPFSEYAQIMLAEIDIESNQAGEAVKRLKKVKSATLQDRANFLRAKAYIAQKEYITARDILRKLLSGKRTNAGYIPSVGEPDPAALRWMLAQTAIGRGKPTLAYPLYWRIWTDNPTSDYALKAENALTTKGHRIPDSTTSKGREYITKRAKTLSKLYLTKEALALYRLLPFQANDQAHLKRMAYTCFKAKEYQESATYYSKITSPSAEQMYHHAVAITRTGDYPGATDVYTQLLKKYPQHKRGDLASFKIAYLDYDKGNLKQAILHFRTHLRRYPTSKHADEARWFTGWSLYRLEKFDEAQEAFKVFLKKHPRSSLAPAAMYWLGKTHEQNDDTAKANEVYDSILKKWPTSGHAWFASQKRNSQFAKTAPIKPNFEGLTNAAFKKGMALAEVGYSRWARQELRSAIPQAKTKNQILLMAHALIYAGDYRKGRKLAKPYCVKPWKKGEALAQQACYPRPHYEGIEAQLENSQLPKLLPYAIMNAESGLKPWVTSPAGARGLMQLMPYVAENHHGAYYPNTTFTSDDLYVAGYNATMGVAELMHLQEEFSSQELESILPLVIASYNGGKEAVHRWLGLYETTPSPERFSEDVGYTETRKYVRKVLGYFMEYRFVYGDY